MYYISLITDSNNKINSKEDKIACFSADKFTKLFDYRSKMLCAELAKISYTFLKHTELILQWQIFLDNKIWTYIHINTQWGEKYVCMLPTNQ